MNNRPQMHSPIHRARDLVVGWMEALPEGMQQDAIDSLDRLCVVAEQQANEAWWDGYRSRKEADTRAKHIEAATSVTTDKG